MEWEDILPIEKYTVRVPFFVVHALPEILQLHIKMGLLAKKQQALRCAWRLHWWRRPWGRAFEVTMCELKRRLLQVRGLVWA